MSGVSWKGIGSISSVFVLTPSRLFFLFIYVLLMCLVFYVGSFGSSACVFLYVKGSVL